MMVVDPLTGEDIEGPQVDPLTGEDIEPAQPSFMARPGERIPGIPMAGEEPKVRQNTGGATGSWAPQAPLLSPIANPRIEPAAPPHGLGQNIARAILPSTTGAPKVETPRIVPDGMGGYKRQDAMESHAGPLETMGDLGGFVSRASGTVLDPILPWDARGKTPDGKRQNMLQGMQDPETGYLRPVRKMTAEAIKTAWEYATDEDKPYLMRSLAALMGETAALAYLGVATAEDPTAVVPFLATSKVGRAVGEAAGSRLQKLGVDQMYKTINPGINVEKKGFDVQKVFDHGLDQPKNKGILPGGNNEDILRNSDEQIKAASDEMKERIQAGVDEGHRVDMPAEIDRVVADILSNKNGSKENQNLSKFVKKYAEEYKQDARDLSADGSGKIDLMATQYFKQNRGDEGKFHGHALRMGFPAGSETEKSKVAEIIYHHLNDVVDEAAPAGIRDLNRKISEIIPIRQAAAHRKIVDDRKARIGLTDLVSFAAAMHNPIAGAGLYAAAKASKSGRVASAIYRLGEKLRTAPNSASRVRFTAALKKLGLTDEEIAAIAKGVEESSEGGDAYKNMDVRVEGGRQPTNVVPFEGRSARGRIAAQSDERMHMEDPTNDIPGQIAEEPAGLPPREGTPPRYERRPLEEPPPVPQEPSAVPLDPDALPPRQGTPPRYERRPLEEPPPRVPPAQPDMSTTALGEVQEAAQGTPPARSPEPPRKPEEPRLVIPSEEVRNKYKIPEDEEGRILYQEEEGGDIHAKAKAHYGVTKFHKQGGFMNPDGELLDFGNGGREMADQRRTRGHEDAARFYPGKTQAIGRDAFMRDGNIRLYPEDGSVEIRTPPTPEQKRALADWFGKTGRPIEIEVNPVGLGARMNDRVWIRHPKGTSHEVIARDIDAAFQGKAIAPQSDMQRMRSDRNMTGGNDGEGRILYQEDKEDAPVFYSQLKRAVEDKMPNRVTPDNLRAMLKSAGVKDDEMKWTAMDDLLKDKATVSKKEVLDHLAENQVQVKETTLGGDGLASGEILQHPDIAKDQETLKRHGYKVDINPEEPSQIAFYPNDEPIVDFMTPEEVASEDPVAGLAARKIEAFYHDKRSRGSNNTKYSAHTLPGGEDYKELLLQLPPRVQKEPEVLPESLKLEVLEDNQYTGQRHVRVRDDGGFLIVEYGATRKSDSQIRQDAAQEANRMNRRAANEGLNFHGSHYDGFDNVLAHIRFNTRTTKDGKKVLFIEEIQSDWHQKGRRKGYKSEETRTQSAELARQARELMEKSDRHGRETGDYSKAMDMHRESMALLDRATKVRGEVPDAPFSKTWHELAMRRMLRYAAEHDYDYVSWTTGAQQANRYDLSKHIDALDWTKNADGTYALEGTKGSASIISKDKIKPEAIEEYVGKDVAQQIVGSGMDKGTIEAEGLKVGGEGMKGFYDKMLPQYLSKYGKKWGANLERLPAMDVRFEVEKNGKGTYNIEAYALDDSGDYTTEAVGLTEAEAHARVEELNKAKGNTAIPITPEMKKSVLKDGQNLFQNQRGAIKGQIQKKGLNSVITLYKGRADATTVLHEYLHKLRSDGTLTPEQDAALLKWAGARSWTVEAEEKFARGGERYIYNGVPPTKALRPAFETLKRSFRESYKEIQGTALAKELPPEVKLVFDALFLRGQTIRNMANVKRYLLAAKRSAGASPRILDLLKAELSEKSQKGTDAVEKH